MPNTTYYFATFSVTGTLTTLTEFDPDRTRADRVRDIMSQYVNSDGPVSRSGSGDWYFGAIEEGVNTIVGKFGKVYTDEPTTYDESKGDFVDEGTTTTEADYSMFYLDFDKNFLIYHSRNRIGHQQFIRNFSDGFVEVIGGDVGLEIELIKNKADFDDIVSNYPVLHAEFELEPSNPHNDPDWEALDDHIKEMLASKLGIEADHMEGESLNFDDDILYQVSQMAKSDYGEYEIVYNDGHVKIQSSDSEEPVQKDEETPESLVHFKDMASGLLDYASSFLE